jgi:uncharacterized protein YjbI with pentapeptide repeats
MSEHYGSWSLALLEEVLATGSLRDAVVEKVGLAERAMAGQDWESVRGREIECFGSDFSGASWKSVAMEAGNFKKALFADALLDDADFTRCNLTGSDFSRARWERCRVAECVGANMNLSSGVVNGSHFRNADLTRAKAAKAVFFGCVFEFPGNLGMTGLRQSQLAGSIFVRCSLSGECLDLVDLEGVVFSECRFEGIAWDNVEWHGARFVDCVGAPRTTAARMTVDATNYGQAMLALEQIQEQLT